MTVFGPIFTGELAVSFRSRSDSSSYIGIFISLFFAVLKKRMNLLTKEQGPQGNLEWLHPQKRVHLNNEKTLVVQGIKGIILPSDIGIIINHEIRIPI